MVELVNLLSLFGIRLVRIGYFLGFFFIVISKW